MKLIFFYFNDQDILRQFKNTYKNDTNCVVTIVVYNDNN